METEKLCRYGNNGADWALTEEKGQDFDCCVGHFDWNGDDIHGGRSYLGNNCRFDRVDSDTRDIRGRRNSLSGGCLNCCFGYVDSDESSILEEQNYGGTNCWFGRVDSGDGDCGLMS